MNVSENEQQAPDFNKLRKVALTTPSGLLAFGFGSGLSPLAPGTMGTLVAIPIAVLLKSFGVIGFWLALVLMFIVGVQVCTQVSHKLGVHDHGGIVWDEIVGYCLAIAFVPLNWQWFLAGFILFRFFDIYKPWPIRQIDRKVSGGFGIMIDDVVAALFAIIILGGFQYFLGSV